MTVLGERTSARENRRADWVRFPRPSSVSSLVQHSFDPGTALECVRGISQNQQLQLHICL